MPDNVLPARALAAALESQPSALEAWWSVHTWDGGHRSADRWKSASGVGIDIDAIDSSGKHCAPPPEVAADVQASAIQGKIPGSVLHLTPRGFRVAFMFANPVTDREIYFRCARWAATQLQAVLPRYYAIDEKALLDLARLLYSPNAQVEGVQRRADVVVMREEPFDPDLMVTAPVPLRLAPMLAPPSRPGEDYRAAVARYNAEHPQEWPRSSGDCPACGHRGCFGQLANDPSRWACFSASHATPGIKGPACYHGDALDLAALEANCTPTELLKREGYLAPSDHVIRVPRALLEGEPAEVTPLKNLSKSYASLCALLRNDKRLVEEAIEWNEMLCADTIGGALVTDETVSKLREKIELLCTDSKGRALEFAHGDIDNAIKQVASEHPYHPVREYLKDLKWDGTPRISHVAEDILGIEASHLTQTMLRKWFVSAVARPLDPGCQVDTVPVLIGPQGAGKSTFFRTLVGDEWFSDAHVDLESADGARMMSQFWVIEWSELHSMHRAKSGALVKGFLTRRVDTFRAPYARRSVSIRRHSVIVGTTNDAEFLSDPTGNRRFWPIRVPESLNLELLKDWRDQIWAEAVSLYRAGEAWHLDSREALLLGADQVQHEERHPWEDTVRDWADVTTCAITTGNVLEKAIQKPKGQWTRGDEMQVAKILKRLGYQRSAQKVNADGGRSVTWTNVKGAA